MSSKSEEQNNIVTQEQFSIVIKEIDDIRGVLREKGKGWQWWAQWITSVALVAMTAAVLPWGVWVTRQLQETSGRLGKIEEWKNIGPRFTCVDAENLRLRVLSESATQYGERIGKLDAKLDGMSDKLTTLSIAIQSHLNNPKP